MLEFNKHANVIHKDAGEKNVAAVVLYDDGSNLYWDANHEHPVYTSELIDLFFKTTLFVYENSNYYKAVRIQDSDDIDGGRPIEFSNDKTLKSTADPEESSSN